ncbi:MAG TPA: FecR family protein [Phycisphaerae bacterium]|nr:FecR family protein [Phycisphaerae bacterium]
MPYERDNMMSCQEAQTVSFLYLNDDPSLTPERREDFEIHLLICSACADEHEENELLFNLLRQHGTISEGTGELLRGAGYSGEHRSDDLCTCGKPYRPTTVGQGWDELKRRCPSLAAVCRRDERKRKQRVFAWRIGSMAAAACILIATGFGWLVLRNGDARQAPSGIAVNTGGPSVPFAELVTDQGRRSLTLNHPVATDNQTQEILLGGMHRVVMSRNTKATFMAAPALSQDDAHQDGEVPYEIQLAQGELYVEVVPGHPFIVKTANARLDITGTKFDVRADGDKTELTLLKGSVRFSALDHPQQAVIVTAGHASTITGRRAPSAPTPADAVATTAWARDTALNNAIALVDEQKDADLSNLSMMSQNFLRQQAPSDVDKLDYEKWRDTHGQFRFASTALAAQKNQAIKADWIELLMVTGDIWQFHYDPKLPAGQPLTKIEPLAIARLALHFGLDEREMLQSFALPESALTATSSVQDGTPGQRYSQALRRWHDAVMAATPDKRETKNDLKLFSLYASHYLAETRTAAYLWAKSHPDKTRQLLANREYLALLPTPPAMASNGTPDVKKWLKQLREQGEAARSCVPSAMEWLLVPPGTGCAYQATEQQRRLAALVAELVLSSEQREGRE